MCLRICAWIKNGGERGGEREARLIGGRPVPGKTYSSGRLSTVNLLIRYVIGCFVKKKSTVLVWEQVSTRRSTVLMVPLQLGFLAGALNWKRAQ